MYIYLNEVYICILHKKICIQKLYTYLLYVAMYKTHIITYNNIILCKSNWTCNDFKLKTKKIKIGWTQLKMLLCCVVDISIYLYYMYKILVQIEPNNKKKNR